MIVKEENLEKGVENLERGEDLESLRREERNKEQRCRNEGKRFLLGHSADISQNKRALIYGKVFINLLFLPFGN